MKNKIYSVMVILLLIVPNTSAMENSNGKKGFEFEDNDATDFPKRRRNKKHRKQPYVSNNRFSENNKFNQKTTLQNEGNQNFTSPKILPNEYRSPYHDIKTEDLPPLNHFFHLRIPNRIICIIDFLKKGNVERNFKTGVKKGLIICGPPGTGKSTIAEHIARRSGRKILFANGSDFKTKWQGSGSENIKKLFDAARELKEPVVVIIDEIDGTTTKVNSTFSTSEDNQAVKRIIAELNAEITSKDSSIYIICTSNYPEKIEGSILNRFDYIEIEEPDYNSRMEILKYYLNNNGIEINTSKDNSVWGAFLEILATATRGWSGRDLQTLINNAVNEFNVSELSPECNQCLFWDQFSSNYENTNSILRFNIKNFYDFKDGTLGSIMCVSGFFILCFLEYMLLNPTRMEKFIFSVYCAEQKRIDKEKQRNSNDSSKSTFSQNARNILGWGTVLSTIAFAFKSGYKSSRRKNEE